MRCWRRRWPCRQQDGLRRWTYHYLFGLIAVTGMRLSEAIGLERDDVDLDDGRADGPTDQVRQVAARALASDDQRGAPQLRQPARCASRIALRFDTSSSPSGWPIAAPVRPSRLLALVPRDRAAAPGDHTGPRVHDFRHRFAIRTLLDWYREGKNVEQQLPVLSTYLGHACVRDTYWYLSACPELMEEAARRLDRRWEATP